MTRRSLRGTKITGKWDDKHPEGWKGKKCEITSGATMHDVRECAKVCSTHFFDADTLRFFKSRIGEYAYGDGHGGAYFVTSEKGPSGVRRYSVRRYDPKRCAIETVGEFQQYGTSKAAYAAAKRTARE